MLESDLYGPLAAILVGISTGVIVIADDRRVKIGLLALQYILSAALLDLASPIQIVVIKLVTGLTVCLILVITTRQISTIDEEVRGSDLPAGRVFRIIAVLLVTTSAIGIGRSDFVTLPGIPPESLSGALLLGGLGLLQVSLLEKPTYIAFGIFSLLNGFEIAYVVLESSLAVIALLALVHICIAVVIGIIELDVEEHDVQIRDF